MEDKEFIDKYFNSNPIEVILCIYCGARLNRVGKINQLPTSCSICGKHNFTPSVKQCLCLDDWKGYRDNVT